MRVGVSVGLEGNAVAEGESLPLPNAPEGVAVAEMENDGEAQKEGEALTVTVAVPLPVPPAAFGVPVAREALPVPDTRWVIEKVTEGEPDCDGEGERLPPARELLPVGELVGEVVPLGVSVTPDADAEREPDTEPVLDTEKLGLGEAQGVAVRVLLTQLVGLGEGEEDRDTEPRADVLGEGVMDAERHRVAEEEGERVMRVVAVTNAVEETVPLGVVGPSEVDDAEGAIVFVPVGGPVADTAMVAELLPLESPLRLTEGHADPVRLTEAHAVTERVTVLQMLRVPDAKVGVSVKEPVELCDEEARAVSVWLTLLDCEAVPVTVELPLRELVTQGLPLTELELEALLVPVPERAGERLSEREGDMEEQAVAREVPLAVGTSLREGDEGADALPELVTVAVPLGAPLGVELAPLDAEALALRELLGERHAEGDREGLAELDGEPSARVRVGIPVGALLEDAELQMLSVKTVEREGEALAVSTTDSEGVAVEVMVDTAEREGVGVLVVMLIGEGVAASPEGLRALDAVGELVPEVGAVAEFVAHCVSVTVPVPETQLEALAEGKNSDGVGAFVTVALYVPLTVSVADAVKDADTQLDSDGEKDTVTVRVEVTLSGSVGRDVADAEGVPVRELVTVGVGVFPVVPLAEDDPVLEGDVEPVKMDEDVELNDTVPVEVGEKVIVAQEVDDADCDSVSVLLRLYVAVVELVIVAPREGVTVTDAVSCATVPVAEAVMDGSMVREVVPETLATGEREPDAQLLLVREMPALAEKEPAGEGDLLWEPLPVMEGVEGAESENVISADAVLLLVEDSEVLGVRVPTGVAVEQPMEALTLGETGRESVAEDVGESTPELEELITDRVDCEGVLVWDTDAGGDLVALKAGVSDADAHTEAQEVGEGVDEREAAGEELAERDARELDESELEPQSDDVGEPPSVALAAPV